MRVFRLDLWRALFILATLLLAAGGPQHPKGTMAEMLRDPAWLRAHALMFLGFVALLFGLLSYAGSTSLPNRTRRWLRLAIVGTLVQTIEMGFHTAAAADSAHLLAGAPTPILTIHLWMAVVIYPFFAMTIIGLILAGARDRVLGSYWIAWLGILGAVAHGVAPPLVIVGKVERATLLFPFLMLLALWLTLAALWPRRAVAPSHRE